MPTEQEANQVVVAWWERALVRVVLAIGTRHGTSGHGEAHGILRLFRAIEGLLEGRRTVVGLGPGTVVRYELAPLPARDLPLDGGLIVPHGEQIIIIHFDNHVIASLRQTARGRLSVPWEMFKMGRHDFAKLAALTLDGTIPSDVRVLWGETVVYPALARLGFKTRPGHRPIRDGFLRLFMLSLMAIYGEDTLSRLEQGRLDSLRIGEAWMTTDELRRRFLPRDTASGGDTH